MLFRKSERKKHSAVLVLTVGALATVGALSITKYARDMMCDAKAKIKDFFSKKKCDCQEQCEG